MVRRTVISTIKQLPPDIRKLVDRLIRQDSTTQAEILGLVNDRLEQRGADPISRSALSRYATNMRAAGARLRQTLEITRAWTQELGEMPEGDIGRLLVQVIQSLAYDTAGAIAAGEEPAAPKEVMALARAARDAQHAASLSAATEIKIREQVEKETARKAADRAVKAASDAGEAHGFKLPPEALRAIREQVYGIVGSP